MWNCRMRAAVLLLPVLSLTAPVTMSAEDKKMSSMPSVLTTGKANPKLDQALQAIVDDPVHTLTSLAVVAVKGGKISYQQQFGNRFIDVANPANNKRADAQTMYRIASISKLITTLGVMKLLEEGKLDLDRDVGDYLGYPLRNPHFPDDAITLRMLMSHTSSLRDDGGYYWPAPALLKDALVPGGSPYGKGAMWSKKAKPGAYFQYANLPWGVIGNVMERVSNERFDRLMKRLVFAPMDLRGGFNPAVFSAEELANLAPLYRKRTEVDGKEIWNSAGPWVAQVDDFSQTPPVSRAGPDYLIGSNGTLFGPQGGARISAADLAKVMLTLMNGGKHGKQQILKPQTVALMLRVQWQHNGKGGKNLDSVRAGSNGDPNGETGYGTHGALFNAWGLGNQHFLDISGPSRGDRLVEQGGFKAVGHFGDAWGLKSILVFDPKSKNGMIYIIGGHAADPETNIGKYSGMYRHEEQILTTLFGGAIK